MRVVSDRGLDVTLPEHWERAERGGALCVGTDDGAARLEFKLSPHSLAAATVRSGADLLDRVHNVARGYRLAQCRDESAKDSPRMAGAASFVREGTYYRLWEFLDGGRLISALFTCPEKYSEWYLPEAEGIVRSATAAAGAGAGCGSIAIGILATLALMLLSDVAAYVALLAAGDFSRFFNLLMMLWLVWAPCMALGWFTSRGRLRVIGLLLATIGDVGATLWIAGPAVLFLFILVAAWMQDPLTAVAVGFVCLLTQGFHFFFAMKAVSDLAAIVVRIFSSERAA